MRQEIIYLLIGIGGSDITAYGNIKTLLESINAWTDSNYKMVRERLRDNGSMYFAVNGKRHRIISTFVVRASYKKA